MMNDYMNMQLLQRQRQQRMFPSAGRRASLLACMDEEGKIDPIRYIEYSRMKRANFLYHMNNLFPGGGAANLIPSSSTTTPSAMTMMAMRAGVGNGGMMTGGLSGGTTVRNSSFYMNGLPSSLPGASASLFKSDFSRTGVFVPRMNNALFDMDRSNTSMISTTSSFPTSPQLKASAAAATSKNNDDKSTASAKEQSEDEERQLRKDEYEAAEALLFSMGRACPSGNDDKAKKEQQEKSKSKTKTPKKVVPKKKQSQSRKTKISLPINKSKKTKMTTKRKKTKESQVPTAQNE